jgi:hypothetical protein
MKTSAMIAWRRWHPRRVVVLGGGVALWCASMGVMLGLCLSKCERPSRLVPVVEEQYPTEYRYGDCKMVLTRRGGLTRHGGVQVWVRCYALDDHSQWRDVPCSPSTTQMFLSDAVGDSIQVGETLRPDTTYQIRSRVLPCGAP